VEVVTNVFIKFSCFRIFSNFHLKNSSGILARDVCLVTCLQIFLANKNKKQTS
jgi:hypothetical protein